MKVSVIIPSYRPGNYVYECLDSLMNQSLDALRFEVIVVLNGTRDPYWEQLSRYAKRHGNIRLLHEAVAGVSNARNVGMKHAWGDFYAFVDDDDVVSSNYLEELLKISTPTILGVSNVHSFVDSVDNWDNDFFACKVIQEQRNLKSLFKNRSILSFPVAKLIHRDMVCGRQFDVRFANGEDSLFITKISDKIIGFAFTDLSACYFVRKREGSATRHNFKIRSIAKDSYSLIRSYVSIYLASPSKYNFLLFLSRIPGVIKGNVMMYLRNR